MRYIITLMLALAALTAGAAAYTVESVPDVHRQNRDAFVANPDGVLSPQAEAEINARLSALRRTTGAEPMVVAVDNIEPADIETFATELFERWGLGKGDTDNGLLLLLVREMRKVTIRPGYGLEGVLPDITCGRIIREDMIPDFSRGDYSAGMLAGVDRITAILSDPAAAAEYRSSAPDADNAADDADGDWIFYWMALITAVMAIALAAGLIHVRGRSDYDKYRAMVGWRPVYLALTFLGLGAPLPVTVPLVLLLSHWRNHRRRCPGCGAAMDKVDEVNDNSYLTPSQDLEERLGSVDYDVWLCRQCGETDILAYNIASSPMVECENCHARTARLAVDRVIRRPTSSRAGQGVREYECLNCRHRMKKYYELPRDASADAAAVGAAIGILGGLGGRSGGGGTFGGGFGGGHTGGGGATGGW